MLTQARLKTVLRYDRCTGAFYWRVAMPRGAYVQAGARAGTERLTTGYWEVGLDGRTYKLHRLAWLYVHGQFPQGHIDHKNRNPSDNRIVNLRVTSNGRNRANSKTNKNNRSGMKGVYKNYYKWIAVISVNKKQIHLGSFPTAQAAHRAYCVAAKNLHGEFFYKGS